MKIENLDELDKLISLCRKRGVSNIEIDGMKFELGNAPPSNYKRRQNAAPMPEDEYSGEMVTQKEEPHDFLKTLLWSSNDQSALAGAMNE